MARQKGSANFSGTIEPLAGGALDARDVVQAKADLTANGSFPYPYIGMETYVVAENKKYRLVGADPTVLSNWEEIGSGGGGGGNINDETPTFTEASTRANIASGEKISVIMGKIQKFFTDLKTVAFSGSYSDLSNKPTIPDELADLTDDSTHRVVTDTQISSWNNKQSALTAGTGIDITNGVISATGGGGSSYTAGDGIVIENDVISVDEMASADMSEIIDPLPSVGARLPRYSTEEQIVGYWIDGKPIYQKTISKTNPVNGDTLLSNVANLISATGQFIHSNKKYSFPYSDDGGYMVYTFTNTANSNEFKLNISKFSGITDCTVIMTYTKTTD